MASDWESHSLTDLYEIRSGLSKPRSEFGFGHGFLTFKDVMDNFFVPEKLGSLVNSTEKERIGCSVQRGDVFLTRTSETQEDLGLSSVALRDHPDATFNGFTKRLRPKPGNQIEPEYAAYYFRGPQFRREVTAMSSLSTRASLNNGMIERLTITIPPVEIQKAIGSVLKTLDDKIELNRRMNETLESMARAIFKSWFVDFDPVRAKMDGRQPTGMDEATCKTAQDWIDAGILLIGDGYRAKRSELGDTGLPFVRAGNLRDHGFNFDNVEILSEPSVVAARDKVSVPYDVAFTSKGTVGRLTLVTRRTRRFVYSPQICWWRVKDRDSLHPHVLYRWMESASFMDQVSRVKGQTDMADYVSLRDQRRMEIALPPITYQSSIGNQLEAIDEKIAANVEESNTLAVLRDTLLPKLLSGKLRVGDAIKQVTDMMSVATSEPTGPKA